MPRPLRTLAAAGCLAAVVTAAALVGRPGGDGAGPRSAPAAPPTPGAVTATDGGGSTAAAVAQLQARLRSHPNDLLALDSLGAAYLQRMRETYDYSYLTRARTAFRIVLKQKPDDLSALLGTSSLAGTQHRFEAQLADARHALRLAPASAAAQGLAGDALAELGRYGPAFGAYQASVDRRPDLSSYARGGQARYLQGDLAGAGRLYGLAIAAGGPVAENTEWARVQLGQMLFKQGRLAAAERVYRRALADLPGYHRALYGLGQVAAARRHWKVAARYLQQASDAVPVPDYLVLLGDVQTAAGNRAAAADAYGLVRVEQRLFRANGGRPGPRAGPVRREPRPARAGRARGSHRLRLPAVGAGSRDPRLGVGAGRQLPRRPALRHREPAARHPRPAAPVPRGRRRGLRRQDRAGAHAPAPGAGPEPAVRPARRAAGTARSPHRLASGKGTAVDLQQLPRDVARAG